MKPVTIGVTNCSKYDNYKKWLLDATGTVEVIRLSYQENNKTDIDRCDAILLTGGEDIDPGLYHHPEYTKQFDLTAIDKRRDDFEYQVIGKTLQQQKPLLCICRGLQVMNTFLGGTLIPDIPAVTGLQTHHKINGIDQQHTIFVNEGSLLHTITGSSVASVNSAHHQSIDRAADDLMIIARAEQPIAEAMQWKDAANKSWLLLLQWHPERMPDQQSPFASAIRAAFLKNCIS